MQNCITPAQDAILVIIPRSVITNCVLYNVVIEFYPVVSECIRVKSLNTTLLRTNTHIREHRLTLVDFTIERTRANGLHQSPQYGSVCIQNYTHI